MSHVLVSVPNTGYIHKHVAFSLLKLIQDKRHKVNIIMPTHNPYENNLHYIVKDFLKGDYSHWLNIDSDNPPTKNPLDLIEYDLDVVGLPTPVYHYTGKKERPVYWNAYKYIEEKDAYMEWDKKEGLQLVDAVGTGCVLYARRVFENKEMQKAPFQRVYNIDGTVERGNDIAFCERAKKQGFLVYAHYDYICNHFNEVELNETVQAFNELLWQQQQHPGQGK